MAMERFREHAGELLILLSLSFYAAGILSLTSVGSPILVLCGYGGTMLLVGGILMKLGLFPTRLRTREGYVIVLVFISAFLFNTSLLSLFADIHVNYRLTNAPSLGSTSGGFAGDYWEHPNVGFFGVNFTLMRPFAWLFLPLFMAAIVTLIVAIAIELTM